MSGSLLSVRHSVSGIGDSASYTFTKRKEKGLPWMTILCTIWRSCKLLDSCMLRRRLRHTPLLLRLILMSWVWVEGNTVSEHKRHINFENVICQLFFCPNFVSQNCIKSLLTLCVGNNILHIRWFITHKPITYYYYLILF